MAAKKKQNKKNEEVKDVKKKKTLDAKTKEQEELKKQQEELKKQQEELEKARLREEREKEKEQVKKDIEEKHEEVQRLKARQVTYFVIIVILLLLLLFFGLGFFAYERQKYSNNGVEETKKVIEKEPEEQKKEYPFNIDDNNIVTTRLIAIMGVLNNPYIETQNDMIGYIYKNGHNDTHTISNEYIIYTALNYLANRNELEDNEDSTYNRKVKGDIVDKVIKNIFGDISYNSSSYKGNTLLCPMGYYDEATDYYFISTDCSLGNLSIETYNYRIIETPSKIDVYQAKAYVKDTDDEHIVYRDDKLLDEVSTDKSYEIGATNYQVFKQYKFTFVKGSDGLFHFDSINIVG